MIDWDNPFKIEDFDFDVDGINRSILSLLENAARLQANARFRELIKEHGKVVYTSNPENIAYARWSGGNYSSDTHTAILICEKEIK